MKERRPKLAVWKFSSCDGCQLSLLDCEDELLTVAGAVEICYFPEATRKVVRGPYDVSLVEGSVTTPDEAERIHKIRRMSRKLIAIGACATAGGIQALRNFGDVTTMSSLIYARPEVIDSLSRSTPMAHHVPVDFELRGCPINKYQLLEVLNAFLNGRRPNIPSHSVCLDCKRRGIVCVMTSKGMPCLGPVTHTGCDALCPRFHRACFGCFGPVDNANTVALSAQLKALGLESPTLLRLFRSFTAGAPAFSTASESHEKT